MSLNTHSVRLVALTLLKQEILSNIKLCNNIYYKVDLEKIETPDLLFHSFINSHKYSCLKVRNRALFMLFENRCLDQ